MLIFLKIIKIIYNLPDRKCEEIFKLIEQKLESFTEQVLIKRRSAEEQLSASFLCVSCLKSGMYELAYTGEAVIVIYSMGLAK